MRVTDLTNVRNLSQSILQQRQQEVVKSLANRIRVIVDKLDGALDGPRAETTQQVDNHLGDLNLIKEKDSKRETEGQRQRESDRETRRQAGREKRKRLRRIDTGTQTESI